jgi:flagellar protein FlgJ
MSSDILKTEAPAYHDLAGLSKLKRAAGANDPQAIRTVAEQFEAMFTRMMLKSMRDAVGQDPIFGSNQEQMYQGMADDQLSVQLAKGKGLGLADMLVRQLQKMGVKGASQAAGAGTTGTTPSAGTTSAAGVTTAAGAKAAAAYRATQQATQPTASAATTDVTKANFVQDLWPRAQDAGTLLGVDPRHLIAQAALETNWGQSLPQDASGRSSNNLFGMKTSANWTGAAVTSSTQEFENGAAANTTAQFKAYATPTQSFQDYVALLRNNPRYAAALNTGSDVHAFAAGLQRGGYATDPEYANKIAAVANTVSSLKLSGTQPIPAKAGTL